MHTALFDCIIITHLDMVLPALIKFPNTTWDLAQKKLGIGAGKYVFLFFFVCVKQGHHGVHAFLISTIWNTPIYHLLVQALATP